MSFFYDLNKKLDGIRATPEVTHQQLNERDMGKHNNATTGFAALAKKAGGGEKGERIAGAQFQKMKKAGQLEEMWGDPYHDNAKVDAINAANPPKAPSGKPNRFTPTPVKHHTYDRKSVASNISGKDSAAYDYRGQVEEGPMDTVKKVGKRVAGGINRLVGHGSDEDMRKDLQRKSGVPQTGKKPEQKTTEAAKYRDPKYKDRLYTQEPPDYTYGPDMDDAYDNPKPDDYAGRKRKIGGGEFPSTDPLASGQGIGRSGIKNNILDRGPRKGMPSRNQISSLKGSIKDAHGTHAEPNLPEAGAPMTAKQKSFAKLAPPANKITFADKIAGAKKEVDEMLGDVAAEAMRGALSGGQKKLDKNQNGKLDANDFAMLRKGAKKGHSGEMDEENDFTAHQRPAVVQPKVGSVERGHKHDIKHTATGRMVTRRTDDQGNSVGADDASDAQAGPRGRGRPKGTKGAIGAKGPSGKSKLMTREGADQGQAQQIVDDLAELRSIAKQSQRGGEFPQGFASQLEVTLYAAMKLIQNQQSGDAQVREESKTKKDDHAEKAGKKVTKDIEYDEKKKDKEEEVDESTTSGSVATSTAKKSSGGSMVGKGIYDSMNRELENMIAESMSINMSDSTEGGKSLTITATDEDALKLGMMLKNAGLGGGDAHGGDMHSPGEEPCETCGMPDCGCDNVEQAVDENAPDYPTNTEQADSNFGYSGGLDGPKSTGQSTVPVLASQDDRQHSYAAEEEDAIKRMMEMAGIKQAELKPWEQTMKEDAAEDAADAENDAEDAEAETEVQEDFLESIQRMREIAGIKEAKKPDFPDLDKDGDKKEPISNAIKDKEEKKVDESIFALTNQWKAYKG